MHGAIDLKSKFGQGTTAIFWIPFNKSRSANLGSPLVDTRPVPEVLRRDTSTTGHRTPPHIVVGDALQNAAPPGHLSSGTGNGLEVVTPGIYLSEESVQQEVDRKNIHVLVVEDKYVVNSSHAFSLVCMIHFPDIPIAVLSTSRSLSKQSGSLGSL